MWSLALLLLVLPAAPGFRVAPRRTSAVAPLRMGLKPWQTVPMPDPSFEGDEADPKAMLERANARREAMAEAKAMVDGVDVAEPVVEEQEEEEEQEEVEEVVEMEVEAEASAKSRAFGKKGGKAKKKKKKGGKGKASAAEKASATGGLPKEQLAELVRLEEQLARALDATAKGGVGKQSDGVSKEVMALVEQIEELAFEPKPMLKNMDLAFALMGDWQLRFTNNEAFLKSKGISGTAALPFCNLEGLLLRVSNQRPTAQLAEIVKIFGGKQVVVLKGETLLMEGVVLDQQYTDLDVSGMKPDNGQQEWRVQTKCTFVGDLVWIGRTASNAVFLYRRLPAEAMETIIRDALPN